jgi:hypothetical protein
MTVDAKARCKNGFCRELVTLLVNTLGNVFAQRGGYGFPDRRTTGHVMKNSHFGGLAEFQLSVNIYLVV